MQSPPSPSHSPARALAWALAVALAFGLITLTGGFLFDDWSLLAITEARLPGVHHPLDAYRFVAGAADVRQLTASGPFPWFCAPDLQLGFFRPLSAALLVLDDRLFGHDAFGWHAHAVLWYLALVAAAGLVLRRALDGATAALALLLFAASDSHAMALGWLANRHSTISAALALFALAAHVRAREEGWRPGRLLAPALLALALLSGETALCVLAYLAAYELLGSGDEVRVRARALVPAAALAAAYLVAYKLGGYGARHSGSYIDPLGEPLAYVRVAPGRLLSLIGSFFLGPPADAQLQLRALWWLWPLLGLASIAAVTALLRRAWPALTGETRRGLRWLLAGAVLSFAPSLGAQVGGRLLIVPSLGGIAVCAVLLRAAWRARAGIGQKLLLGALVLMLVVRPAVLLAGSLVVFREYGRALQRIARDSELPSSPEVAVVAPVMPDFITGTYVPIVRLVEGGAPPRAWWPLSLAPCDHSLKRTALDRLELSTVGTPMLQTPLERLYRSAAVPLRRGDVVHLRGMTVQVLDDQDGAPTRLEARFDRSLDDPGLWLVQWRDGLIRRMKVPGVGEVVRIPYRRGAFGL